MDGLTPKVEIKSEGILNILSRNASLVAAVLILGIVIGVWLFLFLYKNFLLSEIQQREEEIIQKEKEVNLEILQNIYNFDQQIKTLEGLLKKHIYFSQALSFIEGITHPKVIFSNFSGDAQKRQISLAGNAKTFTVLAKQYLKLLQDPNIESVNISGISISSEGGVSFSLSIVLKESVFLKQ